MTHAMTHELALHHDARDWSDGVALALTKLLRWTADTFFAKRYGHRAVVLETVAAVPGMVGALLVHLRALRRDGQEHGWVRTLQDEAENERMHLVTFMAIARPHGSKGPSWSSRRACSSTRSSCCTSSRRARRTGSWVISRKRPW